MNEYLVVITSREEWNSPKIIKVTASTEVSAIEKVEDHFLYERDELEELEEQGLINVSLNCSFEIESIPFI